MLITVKCYRYRAQIYQAIMRSKGILFNRDAVIISSDEIEVDFTEDSDEDKIIRICTIASKYTATFSGNTIEPPSREPIGKRRDKNEKQKANDKHERWSMKLREVKSAVDFWEKKEDEYEARLDEFEKRLAEARNMVKSKRKELKTARATLKGAIQEVLRLEGDTLDEQAQEVVS